jgi:dihydroorotate dehydrogenase electron transfer subunit
VLSPSPGQPAVRLLLPAAALPAPGQVMLACRPGGDDPLRQVLLPIALHADGLTALPPEGTQWQPGEHLDLLGPVGHGFRPSPARRRWLLAALGVNPGVLLPLMDTGIARGVGVAMWAETPLPPLPPQVEVPSDLDSALDWADYLGLALTPEWLEANGSDASVLTAAKRPGLAEALVILPMPCGTGICGACAIGGARSPRRACIGGPVLALEDLLR